MRNFAAFILLLLGTCFLVAWWMIWRPLPTLDGATELPELKSPVNVDRDTWGIPWIQADSLEDLVTAQGYVVAQDRLWQMDLLRRAAAGELSEIFGRVALEADRENRKLGLREAAEAAQGRMDPQSRGILEAYAKGVNRYIDDRRGRLPIEFTLLHYEPRTWTPADTFLISAYMWKVLTTTWKAKLNRARITALVGPEKARDLFVVDSPLDHYIVGAPDIGSKVAMMPSRNILDDPLPQFHGGWLGDLGLTPEAFEWNTAAAFLTQFEEQTSATLGSNNFVVNGKHTASGQPILANDTHLAFSMPGIWYIIHLTAPGWNVEGFTFPGSPLIIIGHNDSIAWGFTNSNASVQDLYAETLNPSNPLEYQANGYWVTAKTRREVIHVKGEGDDILDVILTRHGPIVDQDPPGPNAHAYALRWTATEPGALDFSYPLLGQATNFSEFLQILHKIPGPGQNAVYADRNGNIGFAIGAWIPIRKNGTGALPVDGATDQYEWTGYVPPDELPKVLNPEGGIIATANARTIGPAYKYFITDRWTGPERTARLYELLTGRKDLRPADANTIQNDILSLPDKFLARQLADSSGQAKPSDPRTKTLIDKLGSWDYRASADSVETSFVEYTRHELFGNLLRPYLVGDPSQYELWEPASEYNEVWWRDKIFLTNLLIDRPAAWLPEEFKSYDDLLMASADQAVQTMAAATPDGDPLHATWGKLHPLEMYHPLGRSGWLQRFLSIGPVEEGGTLDTVKAMGYRHGPAMRFVADLSDFDQSLMEIPAGESGQYASPHYRDQFPEWYAGRGIPAPFSAAAEARIQVHHLKLVP
ncbi:MAG TPA: penicillin acylase family protein [Candidatus Acidoferrales bacterium]|nr:penicillin acylase family protein [Candidatus Acidoferrales bacterium]